MEAKQAFDLCDTNSDGRIDRNELKMYFSNIGIPISDKELDNMMHIADTDCSGFVEFEEFINIMTGQQFNSLFSQNLILFELCIFHMF